MTKGSEKPKRKFEVGLRSGKGEIPTLTIQARYCHVTHRGDLTFSDGTGYDPNVVACFATGSWKTVIQSENS